MAVNQPVPPAVGSPSELGPSQPANPASLVPHVDEARVRAVQAPHRAGQVYLPASSKGFDSDDHEIMVAAASKGELVEDWHQTNDRPNMVLELADGLALSGTSFGAENKSVSGECVFQTGMLVLVNHGDLSFVILTTFCLI